jgi:hypothetical protein
VTSESFRLCPALGPWAWNLPARSLLSLLSLLLPPPLLLSLESLLLSRGFLAGCGLAFESLLRGRTVWLSHGVGVGVWFERVDWSLVDTDRTILLSFSKEEVWHQLSGMGARTTVEFLTNIQHIASSTGVQAQWCIARRAVLRLELLDVLVEAGLVGHMAARELQYPLATKSVFQWLLAHSTLAAHKGPLPPRATSVGVQHSCHASSRSLAQVARSLTLSRMERRYRRRLQLGLLGEARRVNDHMGRGFCGARGVSREIRKVNSRIANGS